MKVLETWEHDGASTRNFLAKKYPCSKTFIFYSSQRKSINL